MTTFEAGSLYITFEALKEINRHQGDESWQFFDSSKKIAWKTHTGFGNKDAKAIGVTTDYVVKIWMGNSEGEGRHKITATDDLGIEACVAIPVELCPFLN